MARVFEYVAVAVSRCENTYGVAPCTAAVGVTGDHKCFNTFGSCQDPANFAETDPETFLYFGKATSTLPVDTAMPDVLRMLTSVSVRAPVLSLGKDLGVRGELRFSLADSPHPDTGPAGDPYRADRSWYPGSPPGTFFGRSRARRTFERGRAVQYVRRVEGQTWAEAEKRHYVLESFEGPDALGNVTIVAKDVLKLAADDRAQAPAISNGRLLAGINNSTTSATLTPTGIGNLEYPASGWLNIGGKEIVSFTRAADALTITRAQYNTTAVAHDADARVQLCLRFDAMDPAEILYDLFFDYVEGMTADNLPLAEWQVETTAFYGRLLSGLIPEPIGVSALAAEIIEQVGLVVWGDAIGDGTYPKVRLMVLRGVSAGAAVWGPTNVPGVIDVREQPDKRITTVWTFHGQINPLLRLDEWSNYRSSVATVAADVSGSEAVIYKIFSRWLTTANRAAAERVNALLLARFATAPREFSLTVFRPDEDAAVEEAGGYRVTGAFLQDETGEEVPVAVQVTSVAPHADRFSVTAEEMLYTAPVDDDVSSMIAAEDDFNLRTAFDQIYIEPDGDTIVVCIVPPDVIVGSTSTASTPAPAFDVGDWPDDNLLLSPEGTWSGATTYALGDWVWHGTDPVRPYVSLQNGNTAKEPTVTGGWESWWKPLVAIEIQLIGRIQGKGGAGGRRGVSGGPAVEPGGAGGTAFYTRFPVRITESGELWGGGGGGGGGGHDGVGDPGGSGGGGQGSDPGRGGETGVTAGADGTTEAPGAGGTGVGGTGGAGGAGGAHGDAGSNGTTTTETGGTGGAAGAAVDGSTFVEIVDSPDIEGSEI